MKVIAARNVHEALYKGLGVIVAHGWNRESRAGPVRVMSEPVVTKYECPTERVLFWAKRDANPFFHFMEGLWMLSGRDDVSWIGRYSKGITKYSDDGYTFNGAYGYRWRRMFGYDQIERCVEMLRQNPDSRRVVLSMFDPREDLGAESKDIPCNLSIHFQISVFGRLDMTVFNRSNDIVWGAYGANAVHFSMLHEFVASSLGVEVGSYWQVSDNWHAYHDVLNKVQDIVLEEYYDPYSEGVVISHPMMTTDPKTWMEDLQVFMLQGPITGFRDRFFRRVVTPMYFAWEAWKDTSVPKDRRIDSALEIMNQCHAIDWRKACMEWLERRRVK